MLLDSVLPFVFCWTDLKIIEMCTIKFNVKFIVIYYAVLYGNFLACSFSSIQ